MFSLLKAVEQTVELLVIWDFGSLIWYLCNWTVPAAAGFIEHLEESDNLACSEKNLWQPWYSINFIDSYIINNAVRLVHFNRTCSIYLNRTYSRVYSHFDGFVQDCSISSALALEILQFCTKSSIWYIKAWMIWPPFCTHFEMHFLE